MKIDKTLEEQFALARSVPENERENYKVIILEKEGTGNFFGFKSGYGYIYNKDPITGEEEYGSVIVLEPQIGVGYLLSSGVGIKSYSKEGAPIKDFEGFFGTVKGTIGVSGIRLEPEMEINGVNNVNWRANIAIGSPNIGFFAGIGHRKVVPLGDLNEMQKKYIKILVNNNKEIEQKSEVILKLWDMIKYAEELKNGSETINEKNFKR